MKHTPHISLRIFNWSLGLLTLAILSYTAAWFGYAHILRTQAQALWSNPQQAGAVLTPPPPRIVGFPTTFKLLWACSIATPEAEIKIPDLRVTFLPVPHTPLDIDMPAGFRFYSTALELPDGTNTLVYKYLRLSFEIPATLPSQWTKSSVQKLHDNQTTYRLISMTGAGPVTPAFTPGFSGRGQLSFDANLQPEGYLEVEFTNPAEIRDLLVAGIASSMGKSFAQGAINALMRTDPATGTDILPITFKLQNQKVYAGPIQIGYIPRYYWPERIEPAPATATPPQQ